MYNAETENIHHHKNETNPLFIMGMNYLLSGDKDKAISILNNILEEEPNNADVLALLAFAYCEREDICQDFVNKALDLEPDNASAIAILGRIHDNRTNYQAARQCYQKSLKIDPDSIFALNGYGKLLLREHAFDKAKIYFEKATRVNSNDVESWRDLSTARLGSIRNRNTPFKHLN